MALLYRAEMRPTKLELLVDWLPGRDWARGLGAGELNRVAAYRFDDPAGQVGIETILVRAGQGPILQVPLTYRDAALPGADEWLIGTSEHSVLGRRWVYDGCGDPVYAAALAGAILADTGQAAEFVEIDGELVGRAPTMEIASTVTAPDRPTVDFINQVIEGDTTTIVTPLVELLVVRRPGQMEPPGSGTDGAALTGRWDGQPGPLPLAYATLRRPPAPE